VDWIGVEKNHAVIAEEKNVEVFSPVLRRKHIVDKLAMDKSITV
jgi:hypothetical protein